MTDKDIIDIIKAYAEARQYIKQLEEINGRLIDAKRRQDKQSSKRK